MTLINDTYSYIFIDFRVRHKKYFIYLRFKSKISAEKVKLFYRAPHLLLDQIFVQVLNVCVGVSK